jgi:flagellar biogenesis protein FliO
MRLALLLLLVPATAFADETPSFQVIDRGTAVEVIAHNVTAAKTGVLPIRSRLEVPLAGHPRAAGIAPKDATVKVVELEDGNLSVKVGFEHPAVIGLAKFAQASQVGPDVHLIFPRIVPADGAAVVMPEPTIPADLVKKVDAAIAPVTPVVGPPPPPPAVTPAITRTPEVPERTPESPEPQISRTPEAPIARTPESPKPSKTIAKAPDSEDAWSKLALYGAIGLAGVGCGAYLLKKKKSGLPISSIDVIAQRSLGGKAKVVWFTAGGREMVVAVTPQSVRMLGQWTATAKPAAMPTAHATETARPSTSSAVSGILRLREKAGPAFTHFNDDIATGDIDADALWAKEILAATGAKR